MFHLYIVYGVINQEDQYISHSSIPKHLIGFNTNLHYKKWSMNMGFHSNLGHYMFYKPTDNLDRIYAPHAGQTPRNLNRMYFDHQFKQSGQQLQWASDLYLQNASFLKMDFITLNYSFGEIFQSFNSPATLDLNASVQNVFVITNYSGKDPEPGGNWGLDYGTAYPTNRTFVLGLQLNF